LVEIATDANAVARIAFASAISLISSAFVAMLTTRCPVMLSATSSSC
jgi:hypothetical protein